MFSLARCCQLITTATRLIQRFTSSSTNRIDFPFFKTDDFFQSDETPTFEHLPGVTRVLGATKPVEVTLRLLAWKKKMISELGEAGFAKMQQETLDAGKFCHKSIEDYLNGVPLKDICVESSAENLWESVLPHLNDITDVRKVEQRVEHPILGYKGYVDCVAKYRNEWCLIDWKTSKKVKRNLEDCYDDPLQIAAYAGALNVKSPVQDQIRSGLIVKIYYDRSAATAFNLNSFALEFYWEQWLRRLAQYRKGSTKMKEETVADFLSIASKVYGEK
uniref:Mitochondrial genome maintenance exonuclease 1 n=1 Tax=Phallusia mammillata TaxID=59560 RepID=A0A6F9DK23_9ASCI|nr:mitochondrial genome maintenance exonuclease 1 [Phallusia mammillata]